MREDHGRSGIREGKEQPPDDLDPLDGIIRLDIGAGHFRQKGWVSIDHVDGYSNKLGQVLKPDVEADVTNLPFPDNYADEARAIHVIEHFYAWQALDLVKEWVRVIKPGGRLAIECPCLEKVAKLMDVPQIKPSYTYWALYGDPRHQRPDMCHKWAYTTLSLTRLMAEAGLADLHSEPPQFHFPIRDMRVSGMKPANSSALIVPN